MSDDDVDRLYPGSPYGGGLVSDGYPRCWRCDRLLAVLVTRPWHIVCSRCKAKNVRD